ncbi:MAG: YggT family protein [Anaerolinea sp.]|nr:YggT family protein [Anaerolinea sp.]
MNDQIALVFTTFLYIILFSIIARSLISWFPIDPRSRIVQLLTQFTDPLLVPVRRILPRTGMIDLSGFVVIILLYVMIAVVNQAAAN